MVICNFILVGKHKNIFFKILFSDTQEQTDKLMTSEVSVFYLLMKYISLLHNENRNFSL